MIALWGFAQEIHRINFYAYNNDFATAPILNLSNQYHI